MPQNLPYRLQCLLHLAEKHGNDSWSKAMYGWLMMYGWLTRAVTTTCSVPPASNYTVATQNIKYKGLHFQLNLFRLLDWFLAF